MEHHLLVSFTFENYVAREVFLILFLGHFTEQVSLNHISPWIGGDTQSEQSNGSNQQIPECKVWRNPLNLFRGAEYQRFYWATNKEPLTYYDMNLSAQDHQTFFTCEGDAGKVHNFLHVNNIICFNYN